MADFILRSDSINVEQIMEQIRARVREKRGVDYTEQQIRELAAVKLEKFLDPRGVRSDLLEQFRRAQPAYEPPELPNFAFDEATLFESHRAPIRWIRRLLRPLLKLLFNPNPLIQALHIQSRLNALNAERDARRESVRRAMDQLAFEVMHNLVIETTRLGIDVKNLKMRVESLAGRLEFNERRARALESVVAYRPSSEADPGRAAAGVFAAAEGATATRPPMSSGQAVPTSSGHPSAIPGQAAGGGEGPGQRSRRRRRRRGRRGGPSAVSTMGLSTASGQASSTSTGPAYPTTSEQAASTSSPQGQGDSEAAVTSVGDLSGGSSSAPSASTVDSHGQGEPLPDDDEQ